MQRRAGESRAALPSLRVNHFWRYDTRDKILNGIRVLDFTQFLSGPFCTMNLADFGAEVIKIERPGTGEVSRTFGPFVNGQSSYYTLVNRGKKSVTLDLKKGRALAL